MVSLTDLPSAVRDPLRAAARRMWALVGTTPAGRLRSMAYFAVYASALDDVAQVEALTEAGYDAAFVAELRAAVPQRTPDRGWRLTGFDGDRALIERHGIRAWAPRADIEPQGARPPETVGVLLPVLAPGASPGFVVRRGGLSAGGPFSRIYLNLPRPAARWAVDDLARALIRAGVPFDVKIAAHPRAYVRRDSAVVYVESDRLARAIDVCMRSVSGCGVSLDAGVPLLTRCVAPGVGVADEPSDVEPAGASHGQWVTGLFVDAADGALGPDDIARGVIQGVVDSGRDPRAPELRGSELARPAIG